MIRGLIDAGTESAIPKKEYAIYGGIYKKIRHPQAGDEHLKESHLREV
jgi:hypothetical protein